LVRRRIDHDVLDSVAQEQAESFGQPISFYVNRAAL